MLSQMSKSNYTQTFALWRNEQKNSIDKRAPLIAITQLQLIAFCLKSAASKKYQLHACHSWKRFFLSLFDFRKIAVVLQFAIFFSSGNSLATAIHHISTLM